MAAAELSRQWTSCNRLSNCSNGITSSAQRQSLNSTLAPVANRRPCLRSTLPLSTPDPSRRIRIMRTIRARWTSTSILRKVHNLRTVLPVNAGKLVFTGHGDGQVRLFRVADATVIGRWGRSLAVPDGLAFSGDGTGLHVVDREGAIGLWNLKAATYRRVDLPRQASHQRAARIVAISPDGKL